MAFSAEFMTIHLLPVLKDFVRVDTMDFVDVNELRPLSRIKLGRKHYRMGCLDSNTGMARFVYNKYGKGCFYAFRENGVVDVYVSQQDTKTRSVRVASRLFDRVLAEF